MQFSSVPAWSFGLKGKHKSEAANLPGPGQYKAREPGWDGGYHFPKSPRSRSKNQTDIGPGKYEVNTSSFQKGGPTIKGRHKTTDE